MGSIPRGYSKMGSYPRCSTFEHTLNFKETTYIQYEKGFEVVAPHIRAASFGIDRDFGDWSVIQLQEGELKDCFWDIRGYRTGGREVGTEWEKIVGSQEVGLG